MDEKQRELSNRDAWIAECIRLLWHPTDRLPDDATTADVRTIASERTGYWPDRNDLDRSR